MKGRKKKDSIEPPKATESTKCFGICEIGMPGRKEEREYGGDSRKCESLSSLFSGKIVDIYGLRTS